MTDSHVCILNPSIVRVLDDNNLLGNLGHPPLTAIGRTIDQRAAGHRLQAKRAVAGPAVPARPPQVDFAGEHVERMRDIAFEGDVARELGLRGDLRGDDFAICRYEEDIVEGERFGYRKIDHVPYGSKSAGLAGGTGSHWNLMFDCTVRGEGKQGCGGFGGVNCWDEICGDADETQVLRTWVLWAFARNDTLVVVGLFLVEFGERCGAIQRILN